VNDAGAFWGIAAVVWVICAVASAAIAQRKGLSGGGYFLLGLFLGVIGLLIAAVAQPAPRYASAPGWYTDPWDASGQRYYDGTQWTGHVSQPGAPR
jgi:hypothetical protein